MRYKWFYLTAVRREGEPARTYLSTWLLSNTFRLKRKSSNALCYDCLDKLRHIVSHLYHMLAYSICLYTLLRAHPIPKRNTLVLRCFHKLHRRLFATRRLVSLTANMWNGIDRNDLSHLQAGMHKVMTGSLEREGNKAGWRCRTLDSSKWATCSDNSWHSLTTYSILLGM